jgi:acyl-coenzyme A thioesterase PaaI-like protein
MSTPLPPAYFEPDGDTFVPTSIANGPWGATISGNYVGGMLGYAVERSGIDADLQPARFTVDLLRPAAMAPLRIRTSVVREGRRLKLVHAELVQDDTVVAMASCLLLRRGEAPPGEVWSSAVTMPPLPPQAEEPVGDVPLLVWAYGRDGAATPASFDLSAWGHVGPKHVWTRDVKPLIAGEPMTPFVRVATAGDIVSSLTHYGTAGLHYINADYTVTLSRLPVDGVIGLTALTHTSADGVGTGSAAIFDTVGQIGTATATALANKGFTPRASL